MSWAECASCGERFTSDSAFDAHLAPPDAEINCFDPATLTNKDGSPKLVQVERKAGPHWGFPGDPENPFSALRGASESLTSVSAGDAA